MASADTRDRLRRELKEGAERGAGLVELLDHLHASSARLSRWDRLSEEERDELSLYCWSLKTSEPSSMILDRADTIWGSLGTGPAARRRRGDRRPADRRPGGLTPQ
jgi:hypothetical protein